MFIFVESEELTTVMLEDIAVCTVTSGIVIKLNLNVPLPPASSKTKMYSIFTIYRIELYYLFKNYITYCFILTY